MFRLVQLKAIVRTRFGRCLATICGIFAISLVAVVGFYGMCFVFRAGHFDILKPRPNASEQAMSRHDALCEASCRVPTRIVFLGDSITEGWSTRGKQVWESEFAGLGAFNMGVSGDRIQNLLWRLDHGATDCATPAGVVLEIGTNNVHYYSADEIVRGIGAAVERIQRLHPNTSILVLSLLPRDRPESRARSIVRQVNSQLVESLKDKERVEVLDVGKDFVDAEDEIPTYLIPDLLHPSESGYRQLAILLRPWIRRIDRLGDPQSSRGGP